MSRSSVAGLTPMVLAASIRFKASFGGTPLELSVVITPRLCHGMDTSNTDSRRRQVSDLLLFWTPWLAIVKTDALADFFDPFKFTHSIWTEPIH